MSANEMPHLFAGEVQFRRYSDTSTQGQQIVLSLADREALQPFIGLEGRRLMAVFVLIGDDEQPEPPPAKKAEKPLKEGPRRKLGPICEWLVYRCKEPAFREWITAYSEADATLTEEGAAEVVREWCGVKSRSEIDGNPKAEALFRRNIQQPWATYTNAAAIADR